MQKITFDVNNGESLQLTQEKPDSNINLLKLTGNGALYDHQIIKNGDFVMLLNLYRYIKQNDIQNDFINPYGKNKEV